MIKPAFPLLLALLSLAPLAFVQAEEVALLQLRLPKERTDRLVAMEFYEGEAPATVANFKKLCREKFYRKLAFHRAFPHMLVQAGDPYSAGRDRSRVGTGGPGYTVPPEIRRRHTAGAVAMARLPDKLNPSRMSNGSQFFVCLQPMPSYDGQYTVFAHVYQGLENLEAVSTQAVDTNDYPLQAVRIRRLQIVPRERVPVPAVAGTAAPAKKKPWWKIF